MAGKFPSAKAVLGKTKKQQRGFQSMKKTGIDHFHIGLGISYPDTYKQEIEDYVSVNLTSEEIDEHKKVYRSIIAKGLEVVEEDEKQ